MSRHDARGRRRFYPDAKLEMSAMIDVVFLLLIFFVVTVRPADILSRLDVGRPAPGGGEVEIPMLKLDVYDDAYVMNGRRMDIHEVDRVLGHLASLHSSRPIVITCAGNSRHAKLIQALDVCQRHDIQNISLMSR